MDSNILITLVWIVTTFLLLGGGTGMIRLYNRARNAHRRAIAPPRESVSYEHTLSEDETQEETWKTYSKRVIEACVETWLSATERSADLEAYRKWVEADSRLSAELGIVLTRHPASFESGTTLFLTMHPDREALDALDALLSHMEYWRVPSSVLLKDGEGSIPMYVIEGEHEDTNRANQ